MRILFILDSVENPTSANVLMAQRLAGVLCAAGHTVHLLELWDGLHPQPELPGCTAVSYTHLTLPTICSV